MTWTNATLNTDGSAIPATGPGSLVRTTVEYGTCDVSGGFDQKVDEIFVPAPAEALTLNPVVVQMYCLRAFHSNTYATSFVALADGNSGFSNVAECDLPPPTPLPPAGLSVQLGAQTAYSPQFVEDRQVLLPVGTVPAGTECDREQFMRDGNGVLAYIVPRQALVPPAGAQIDSIVVYARCG